MRKYIPITRISANRIPKALALAKKNAVDTFSEQPVQFYHALTYDAKVGTLSVRRPNGTSISASGFETPSTIGVGEHGFKGNDGKDGLDGINGIDGTDGIEGLRGDTGERGIRGERGDQGKTGPEGNRGKHGERGAEGLVGNTGKEGREGLHGERGNHGYDKFSYIKFQESEPQFPVPPGGIWYRIVARNTSRLAPCVGTQMPPTQYKSIENNVIQHDPCWRLVTFDFDALPDFDHSNLVLDYDQDHSLSNTIRNHLTALLATPTTEDYTGNISVVNVDNSTLTYDNIKSNHCWREDCSAVRTMWHTCDPILSTLYIDLYTHAFEQKAFVQKMLNGNPVVKSITDKFAIQTIYYDRAGNCPGVRVTDL